MLPEVTETSLSLSFDEQATADHSEQGYTNQLILQHTKQHAQQTKPQNLPRKQQQQDQENDRGNFQKENPTGFAKGKEQLKQVRNGRAPLNSPSREPLKQILPPNQTRNRVKSQKQTQVPNKSHQEQITAVMVEFPNRGRNSRGHTLQGRSQRTVSGLSPAHCEGNGSQTSVKGPNAFHKVDSKQKTSNPTVRTKPQGSEGVDNREFQNLPRQQMISSKQHSKENRQTEGDQQKLVRLTDESSYHPEENQIEKPFLETVFEEHTVDETLNKCMGETELELQVNAKSPVRSVSKTDHESRGSTTGMIIDHNGQTQHGYVQTQRKTEIMEEISFCPMGNEEHHGEKERLDSTPGVLSRSSAKQQTNENEREKLKAREGNNDVHMYQEGTFQKNRQVGDGVTAKRTSAEGLTLPDPYQLLIRQEAQLRELQEQVLLNDYVV